MSDHGAFAAVLVDEIAKKADRLGFDWTLIPATTQSDIDPANATRIVIDGDATAISYAMSLIGPLPKGLRVMVMFVPPHAAYIVGMCAVPAWIPAVLGGNWGTFGSLTVAYRRVGDEVQCRGVPLRTSIGSVTMFTLPAGYLPPNQRFFTSDVGGIHSRVTVNVDGTVTWDGGGVPGNGVPVDQVRFSITP